MKIVTRVLAALPALALGLNGLLWIFTPGRAAENLGTPLLDGVARSTQIGDTGAFFLGTTALIVLGIVQSRAHWLYAAAIFVGGAAVMRTLAYAAHGATFATEFIVPEVVMTAMLLFAAAKIESDG